ncbi:F-box-like domain-containing protein [Ceratobasidium sp. AG-Ba]|nr:F-box-like domain-containing protein [Ceratobasidium sp. AG-Ba]
MFQLSNDPLTRWKSVQARLSNTIKEYTEACAILERSLNRYSCVDGGFSQFDSLLANLVQHEVKLQEARLNLNKARNLSLSFPPIHKLHPELLTMIFTLVTQEWIGPDFQSTGNKPGSATTLASVCFPWRRLLLGSPVFWSQINIVLNGPLAEMSYRRAKTWAERARRAPLWLTIRDTTDVKDFDKPPKNEPVPNSVLQKALRFTAPLMPFVRSLSVNFQDYSPGLTVRSFLASWIRRGSPKVAKRLELRNDLGFREVQVQAISPQSQTEAISTTEFSDFLRSLQSVHIENIAVDWSNTIFSGLTDLCIEVACAPRQIPSQQDIARLLAASPHLRRLIIYCFSVTPSYPTPAPVALDHLEQLGLETMSAGDVAHILPLISTTSNALRVAISLGNTPEFVDAARSFFARTKVTVLHVDGGLPISHPTISSLFARMPFLHTLIIRVSICSEEVSDEFTRWCTIRGELVNPWPALRTLSLFHCEFTTESLLKLVSPLALHTIGICGVEYPAQNERWSRSDRARIEGELSQKGVHIIWHDISENNVPSWSFVML